MKITLTRLFLCTTVLLCSAAWNANAVNLVTNGGFETGNFSGWTHTGDANGFDGVGSDAAFAHSGTHYAFLGSSPDLGSLSQSLTTVAGSFYTLSFYLANDVTVGLPADASFQVFWNGALVYTEANGSPFPYKNVLLTGLVATGGSTTLEFRYHHDNDFWRLDDVQVTVPEGTSTIWLALPTFAALGLVYSRRGRKGLARA